MSWFPCGDPKLNLPHAPAVEMTLIPRMGDIGHFEVQRALPSKKKQMVGPFIFWDQMGPGEFLTGHGVDVRPHPHIGLSTVTYLFKGSLDHKDSLGNATRIVPGDVNLMTAGSGIVHSERTGQDIRQNPSSLYGIQSWLAQPKIHERGEPSFEHIAAHELPMIHAPGLQGRVILGDFAGSVSPVKTQWDTVYVEFHLEVNTVFSIPNTTEERALYLLTGQVEIEHVRFGPAQMLVLRPGVPVVVKALEPTHLMLLGGATMDGPRCIFWNFVSSRKECLEQAKMDWQQGKFAKIPGDDVEFIPLP